MNEHMRNVYKEVNEILEIMGEKYKNKVPINFLLFLKENENTEYKSKIVNNKKFNNQEILYDTKVLLCYLYKKFWSE